MGPYQAKKVSSRRASISCMRIAALWWRKRTDPKEHQIEQSLFLGRTPATCLRPLQFRDNAVPACSCNQTTGATRKESGVMRGSGQAVYECQCGLNFAGEGRDCLCFVACAFAAERLEGMCNSVSGENGWFDPYEGGGHGNAAV